MLYIEKLNRLNNNNNNNNNNKKKKRREKKEEGKKNYLEFLPAFPKYLYSLKAESSGVWRSELKTKKKRKVILLTNV